MKLISLNTWCGKINDPLQKFVKKYSTKIDIFCLQEVYANYKGQYEHIFTIKDTNYNLFEDLQLILQDHQEFYCPVFENMYGVAAFIKKKITVSETGRTLVYENKNFPDVSNPDADHDRYIQWMQVNNAEKQYLIINVHGHWVPGDKNDNEARIKQSELILSCATEYNLPTIICGDFNLKPDTQSIAILEKEFENLVKKYKVKSTRTNLYTKPEKFADYIFVSKDIKVNKFEVLPDVVSDHSPLYLDFD